MEISELDNCYNCKYHGKPYNRSDLDERGTCKRYPPHFYINARSAGHMNPEVRRDGWCGEFKLSKLIDCPKCDGNGSIYLGDEKVTVKGIFGDKVVASGKYENCDNCNGECVVVRIDKQSESI